MDRHMIPIPAFKKCTEIKLLELDSGILVASKQERSFNLGLEMQYPWKGCGSFNQMIGKIAITLSPQDSSRLQTRLGSLSIVNHGERTTVDNHSRFIHQFTQLRATLHQFRHLGSATIFSKLSEVEHFWIRRPKLYLINEVANSIGNRHVGHATLVGLN